MRYGSVCSGIEAASVAFRPLGWEPKFFAEIEPFASSVLKARFPDVRNLGDFTKIKPSDYEGEIDLLIGGTPCQAFSVVGLRKGLDDERGNLALEFARLAFRTKARYVVWENVPGALSSGCGQDFASFVSLLAGWEVSVPKGGWRRAGLITAAPGCFNVGWRVFDAQYTRVSQFPRAIPQRRKRVILVGSLGTWESVAKVLFDEELSGGSAAPSREPWREAPEVCGRLARECVPLDLTNLDGRVNHLGGKSWDIPNSAAYSITRRRPSGVCVDGLARKFTPRECERLMGFPDDWTLVPWKRKLTDAPRYKALGNSMCVNVIQWIAERIDALEKETLNGSKET